jgi:hypothetical protein
MLNGKLILGTGIENGAITTIASVNITTLATGNSLFQAQDSSDSFDVCDPAP